MQHVLSRALESEFDELGRSVHIDLQSMEIHLERSQTDDVPLGRDRRAAHRPARCAKGLPD